MTYAEYKNRTETETEIVQRKSHCFWGSVTCE